MTNVFSPAENSGLVGIWASQDPFSSGVEYDVKSTASGFSVTVRDTNDSEQAEVYDITWDGETLRFSAYWASSGRLGKCVFRLVDLDKIDFTYTYTDSELLLRRP
jgi:hypothetical protein